MTWDRKQQKWTEDDYFDYPFSVEGTGLLKRKEKNMNSTTNIALNVLGTGLVADGVMRIGTDLKGGVVAIVLGILVYVVYELIPTKTS